MNAIEARQLLLVRACELNEPPTLWPAADQTWASEEALRLEGEHRLPEQWLLRRAQLALTRLAQRDPSLAAVSGGGWGTGRARITALTVTGALMIGLASNVIGPSGQVNLLAPPLLAVLAWNLAVMALLVAHAVVAAGRAPLGAAPSPNTGGLSRAMQWLFERPALSRATPANPALRRYTLDWALASQGLQTARITTAMHLAAAALALGAVGGLYLRGLAFEFRAGWDSTFLGADAVHTWLTMLLGPAAWLVGWSLPDTLQIDALRFSRGNGESAARWIHLYAITVAVLVLLPRGLLALAAAWRAGRLERQFPLSLDDPYFQRLLRHLAHARHGTAQPVVVLPYSYRVSPVQQAALAAALADDIGPGLQLAWLPNVPLGGEDALHIHWPTPAVGQPAPTLVVVLFALSATPERETHGAFLAAVQSRCAAMTPSPGCLVVVDESGFRQRLNETDLAARLAQRQAAWRAMVEPGPVPLFLDLGAAAAPARPPAP